MSSSSSCAGFPSRGKKQQADQAKHMHAAKEKQESDENFQRPLPLSHVSIQSFSVPSLDWKDFRTHIGHISAKDREIIKKAFLLGRSSHEGQKRASGDPYFTHCVAIAIMLAEVKADAETLAVALLHDAVEDTSLTLDDIHTQLSPEIARLVDGVTKLDAAHFSDQPNRDAHIETIRKIFTYMQEDIRIIVVKLYDRLHNMQTISALSPEKRSRVAKETLQVYAKVAAQLCMKNMRDRLEYLSCSVLDSEKMEYLIAQNEGLTEETEKVIEHLRGLMQPKSSLHIDLEYCPVSLRWMRLMKHLKQDEDIRFVPLSVSLVAPSIEDCYRTLYLLHRLWRREVLTFDDYINSPQLNGYQGLHTTIILQDGRRVRCMIRTRRMDKYAGEGVLTNCFTERGTDPLSWVASTMTVSRGLARSEEFWQSLQADILGGMILLHGPGDRVVTLPEGATALDGVFYFFQTAGLRTKVLRVDGQEVQPWHVLSYADTLDVEFDDHPRVKREWLEWVRTGVSISKIRKSLSEQSQEKKIEIGRQILQDFLLERGKGFLDEFNQRRIVASLQTMGFSSLDECFISIAEGSHMPEEIFDALFPGSSAVQETVQEEQSFSHYVVRYSMDNSHDQAAANPQPLLAQHGCRFTRMNMRVDKEGVMTVMLRCVCTSSKQLTNFVATLKRAGARDTNVVASTLFFWVKIAPWIVTFLWGVDAVFIRLLLHMGIPALEIAGLRYIVALVFAIGYFIVQLLLTRMQQMRLRLFSPLHPTLFFAALGLFLTSVLSFIVLSHLSAVAYIAFFIPYVTMGVSLPAEEGRLRYILHRVGMWVLPVLLPFILLHAEGIPLLSMTTLLAILMPVGFVLYRFMSNRFLRKENVKARYPLLLLYISMYGALFACALLYYSTDLSLLHHPWLLALTVLQIAIFFVLPYALFFESIKHRSQRYTSGFMPMELIFVVLCELLLLGTWSWFYLLPLLLAPVWAIVMVEKEEKT